MTILFRKLSLLVVLILGIGLSASYAQVQATNGSIQGDVIDSGGAVVPGADVEADESTPDRSISRSPTAPATSSFPSLQPGALVGQGLEDRIRHHHPAEPHPHRRPHRNAQAHPQVAGTTESVVVTSAPLVDVVTDSSTSTLNEQTIATTPVLGRKFEDLAHPHARRQHRAGPRRRRDQHQRPARHLQQHLARWRRLQQRLLRRAVRRPARRGRHHARSRQGVPGRRQRRQRRVRPHRRRRRQRHHQVRHQRLPRQPLPLSARSKP